jgi:hypothetical protein
MRTSRERWQVLGAVLLSILLVACLDYLTNSLDTGKFSWDFRYYIGMAENGFRAPLASPFAYRYVTPLLVEGITNAFGLSVQDGFRCVAYFGAFAQLLGVFLFTRWLIRSSIGAYVAVLVTAFSLFNVKFLLFDVYRPDHLAYGFMLLQTYFALRGKFWPLFASTLIASQIREFNIVPLLAYVIVLVSVRRTQPWAIERRTLVMTAAISVLGLAAALGIPRLVIPIAEDYQFVSLTRDGLLRMLLAPLVLARDANFIFSLIAYGLPVLMIAGVSDLKAVLASLEWPTKVYLSAYSGLVLVLSFFGGTDFYRFATYLFVPQAILVPMLLRRVRSGPVVVMLIAVIIFNRIWLSFPMSDAGTYLDFYGGFGTRFDWASVLRVLECFTFIGIGLLMRRLWPPTDPRPVPVVS